LTPSLVRAAEVLLAHEAGEATGSADGAAVAIRACDKLHRHLARIVGDEGIRALIGRTLSVGRLTYPSAPRSDGVSVDVGATVGAYLEAQPPDLASEASVHLIATLIGLVAKFIGDGLTLRLLRELWPEIPVPSASGPVKEAT
jgi:hypothetical protein